MKLAYDIINNIADFIPEHEKDYLLGMSLDHYGYLKSYNNKNFLNNFVNACMLYRLAIHHRKKLVDTYPDNISYYKDLAWSLDNIGMMFAMVDYDELIGEKGDDGDLCIQGNGELFSYDNEYRFLMNSMDKAEEYLRTALEMRQNVVDKYGDEGLTEVAWTYCNLATLLSRLPERYDEAEEFINKALFTYDIMEDDYRERHESGLARIYVAYGKLLAKWEDRQSEAIEAYSKAMIINNSLELDYPGVYTKEIESINHEIERIKMRER